MADALLQTDQSLTEKEKEIEGENSWKHSAAAKSLQSCLTLCDPTDGSPPGSPVPGILQARTLEWVAISFSNESEKWKMKVQSLSHVRLLATPWTAAYQAPPSLGFSRQEHWSGLPYPPPGNLHQGIQLTSPALAVKILIAHCKNKHKRLSSWDKQTSQKGESRNKAIKIN